MHSSSLAEAVAGAVAMQPLAPLLTGTRPLTGRLLVNQAVAPPCCHSTAPRIVSRIVSHWSYGLVFSHQPRR